MEAPGSSGGYHLRRRPREQQEEGGGVAGAAVLEPSGDGGRGARDGSAAGSMRSATSSAGGMLSLNGGASSQQGVKRKGDSAVGDKASHSEDDAGASPKIAAYNGPASASARHYFKVGVVCVVYCAWCGAAASVRCAADTGVPRPRCARRVPRPHTRARHPLPRSPPPGQPQHGR
jgi:hypothetical protein